MRAHTALALTLWLAGACTPAEPPVITIAESSAATTADPSPAGDPAGGPIVAPARPAASSDSVPPAVAQPTPTAEAAPSVGAGASSVATPTVRESLDDLERLLGEARIVPALDARGEPAGIRLASIQRGSLLERLGFRNRDVVHAVDGEPLTDLPSAMMLASKLDDPAVRTIRVGVRRGDADQVIVVDLDGPLP